MAISHPGRDGLLAPPAAGAAPTRGMTIGAVTKALQAEFPDISISKIRYLEDQKLLQPRRTPGGYRLYSSSDVARLRTILRLQRDEFLPLRVIRQELATGRTADDRPSPGAAAPGDRDEPAADTVPAPAPAPRPSRRAGVTVAPSGASFTLDEVLDETRADPALVRELEEFGVIRGEVRGGTRHYDDTEREIVRAAAELARYGVGGRNLRVFRTSADREAALLQQILAPSLRSHNAGRREEALRALEDLAAVTTHLKHLLLIRDLRKLAAS